MDFDKTKLERFVYKITSPIKLDEDLGLRCLHLNELNKKLEPFYKNHNPENDPKTHQKIFQHAVSYLEKDGWNEAILDEKAGYLVTSVGL